MNKKERKEYLKQLNSQAEQQSVLKKIAEDTDLNATEDAATYSEKVFQKLLDSIKIQGLED
jgi:hypothetical protein